MYHEKFRTYTSVLSLNKSVLFIQNLLKMFKLYKKNTKKVKQNFNSYQSYGKIWFKKTNNCFMLYKKK